MLSFEKVTKSFPAEGEPLLILKGIDFHVESGEFIAVMGPSGSGKSTLLGIAAGLDLPTTGTVVLDGINLTTAKESELARLRRERIGFVFQNFQLLPGLTALENVGIPLYLMPGYSESQIATKAKQVLDSVSMGHRANHFPKQLSGGEEQRIAIARSFINSPRILFADEPTANLDSKNSGMVMEILLKKHREEKTTLVLVTHDPDVAKLAGRILEMRDGMILNDSKDTKKSGQIAKLPSKPVKKTARKSK